MTDLSELKYFSQLSHDWESVTEANINRANEKLEPVGSNETRIGTLHSAQCRILWTLLMRYRAKSRQAYTDVANAESEAEETLKKIETGNFLQLAEMTARVFWLQVHEDMGIGWDNNIGLRSGWMVVITPEEEEQEKIPKILDFSSLIEKLRKYSSSESED